MSEAATSDVAQVLRDFRRTRRRRAATRAAYPVYVVALVAVLYGTAAAGPIIVALHRSRPNAGQLLTISTAVPGVLTGVVALLLLGVLRTATWHGPVAVSAADAQWLLPLPADRHALQRAQVRRSLVIAVVIGAVAGGGVGLLLALVTTSELLAAVLSGAGAGALLAPLSTAAGVLVQRSRRTSDLLLSLTPIVVVLALAVALSGAWSAGPGRVAWWTGPWGWAAVVLSGSVQATGGAALAWLLLAALAVTGVVVADRFAATVPASQLRAAAGTSEAVGRALLVGETRDAAVRIAVARGVRRRRWRLPAPFLPLLVVPWRDSLALLRSPARVGTGALLVAVTATLLGLAGQLHGATSYVLEIVAAATALTAASRVAEPARLDSDDPRRAAGLPQPFGQLALLHALTPTALLLVLGIVAAVAVALVTGLPLGGALLVAILASPMLIAAVLASVFRGRAPLYLAFSGGGVGGAGPAGVPLLALWFVAPAMIGSGLLSYGLIARPSVASAVLGTVFATAALLAWTRGRAASLVAPAGKT